MILKYAHLIKGSLENLKVLKTSFDQDFFAVLMYCIYVESKVEYDFSCCTH